MRALVLSGGAVKGAYQIGVLLKWMGEQAIDYNIMCGVSVGALNIAGLSQVPFGHPKAAIDFVHKFWLEKVTTSAIYKRWFPFGRLHALWKKSVYDSRPLRELIRASLDINKTINCGRQIAVGATCLDTGENRYVRETEPNFVDWVLASSSYPIFLAPISINGQLWSDGGIRCVTPLVQAIHMGAEEIDVIMCSNPYARDDWSGSKNAVPGQVIRTLDLMSDQIMRYDLQIVGLKNDEVELNSQYRKVKIRLVQPMGELVVNSLEFNPCDIRRMIDQGYRDADNAVLYG
jgi:NTE family protein